MAKYKTYPEYKDSGVEWCTALPLGWKRTNLRWLSSIYAGGTPSKNVIDYWENGTIPWINSGAVNQSYVTEPSTFISKAAFENSSAKWIPKGALVVALAGQGKTKGMVAQLGINTTCNQSMAAIVFYEKKLSRYIYWWLTSNYQNIRNMAGGDLRDGLNLELLGDIQCPQPNDGECIRISAFLDHETAKIDNLIEKQQQLIELLKEKRQAVISHAVTKGLNPDVSMKDSGVEWLGEVPEHWTVCRLKQIIKSGTSISYGIVQPGDSLDEGIPFIQTTNISQGNLQLESLPKTSGEIEKNYPRSRLDGGEVILGIRASIGSAYVVPLELKGANLSRGVARIQPGSSITSEYLVWYLKTNPVEQYWALSKQGSTFSEVSIETVRELTVCVPPKDEQYNIASRLEGALDRIHKLIVKSEIKMSLLRERRTALISAAVTGKIDVRDWVAPETQDVEEPQEATA
ncbi:restriction endonuclease subunit S [Kluyvera intermedia]|uniref:Restriction endonuclease subunit S n=1 Tax=Kluyvera intermedia TaxID=61648 RepID=A0ABX3UKJ8_KLUIN|nr:restriction endonuclease subunit S [Kluyvera intermedia]ORJ52030.1 restriction endonuclease subunit S [Kluyvera intermedia]